jgi:hypothetical protein
MEAPLQMNNRIMLSELQYFQLDDYHKVLSALSDRLDDGGSSGRCGTLCGVVFDITKDHFCYPDI